MNVFRNASWMRELGHIVTVLAVEESTLFKTCREHNLNSIPVVKNKKYFDYKNAKIVGQHVLDLNAAVLWCCDKNDISILSLAKKYRAKNVLLLYQQNMQLGVAKTSPAHTIRLRRIDLWITPLNYLTEQVRTLTRFPIAKVKAVPLSVDVDQLLSTSPGREKARAHFKLEEEDVVIGMMGRIDPHKSQHLVIESFLSLANDFPNVKVLFVGAKTEGEWDEYYSLIQGQLKDPRIEGKVSLYPFMENTGYFYEAIDTFVMASEKETFGMVTVEAMAFGKNIAGTNTAGTEELLNNEQYGYYFKPGNTDSLTAALKNILENPEVAKAKGQKAMEEVAAKYNRKNTSVQIEKYIHEALALKK
jgi:D-inositol-3-phosphate glycosyltransferase